MTSATEPDAYRRTAGWFAAQGFPFLAPPVDRRGQAERRFGVTAFVLLVLECAAFNFRAGDPAAYNVLAVLFGPVVLVCAIAAFGRLFVDRYVWRWPARLLICTMPALPALYRWQSLGLFLGLVVVNHVLLFLLATSFNSIRVGALFRWALGETLDQVPRLLGVVVRALPILFVATIILFFTAEFWQMAHRLDRSFVLTTAGALLLVAVAVQIVHLNHVVRTYWDQAAEPDWDSAQSRMGQLATSYPELTPLTEKAIPAAVRRVPPLQTVVRANLVLVLWFAQILQLTVIGGSLGVFLLVFGSIALPLETQGLFVGVTGASELSALFAIELMHHPVVLTGTLVKVALFLSAFTYLSFVLYAASADDYVPDYLPHIESRIRNVILARQFRDCLFLRPHLYRTHRECRLFFNLPPALQATKAVLVWSISAEHREQTGMHLEWGTFRTELRLEPGTTIRYHYEVDGLVFRDRSPETAVSDGVEESVLTVP